MKIDNCAIKSPTIKPLAFYVYMWYACSIGAYTCLLTQPDSSFFLKLILKTCAKEPSPNISSTVISLQCAMASLPKFAKNYKHKRNSIQNFVTYIYLKNIIDKCY